MPQKLILYLLRWSIVFSIATARLRLRLTPPPRRRPRRLPGTPPPRWRRALAVPPVVAAVVMSGTPLLVGAAAAAPLAPSGDGKVHVTITVLGDSFTSGEGAKWSTYSTRPTPHAGKGGMVTVPTVDPAHQSLTAPARQAIDALRAANPDIVFDVQFAAISGATSEDMRSETRPGTPFAHPSQLSQAAGANISVLGIGGNDLGFSHWVETITKESEEVSAQAFNTFLTRVLDPTFQKNLADTYRAVLGKMAADGQLVVTGYPKLVPNVMPSLTGNAVDSRVGTTEAQLSNRAGRVPQQRHREGRRRGRRGR